MSSMDKLRIISVITGDSPNRLRETFFKKNALDTYNEIMEFTSNISDIKFPFKIWHWVNNEPNYIRCYCGKRVSTNMNWRDGYKKYCSNKCSSNSEETKNKLKETNLERYGVDHYSKTDEYVIKVKKTSLSNWGVDNYSKTDEYVIKSKETYLEKYGVDSYTKTNEYLEKSKKTSLSNWGVEFPTQSDFIKNKIRDTNILKYGTSHIENDEYRNSNFNISNNEFYIGYIDGYNHFRCDYGHNHTFRISTDNYYGRIKSNNKLCTICNSISDNSSLKEIMLFDFIRSNYDGEITRNYRDGRLEIDIYLPDLGIGFEFNGLWWHSEKYRDKNYHINKTNYFKERDIRIIHIWEDDWVNNENIIKSQILNWIKASSNRIFARKCEVVEMGTESIYFLNDNHIQGYDRSILKLGLFNDGILVSMMTFNKIEGRKKMKDGEWNLSRFCNLLNTNVVGGASKLLKYFIIKYKPSRIISYADKDWSEGGLYRTLGFELISESKPDYKYLVNGSRVNKSRYRKSNLKTNLSESEYMKSINIYRIWDCGKMKFELI